MCYYPFVVIFFMKIGDESDALRWCGNFKGGVIGKYSLGESESDRDISIVKRLMYLNIDI